MEEIGGKAVKWGYLVKTTSDPCIAAINSYSYQVLSYGREKKVILEALIHDSNCVLANVLVAHFLSSKDRSKALSYLEIAKSRLEQATTYEKMVFDSVFCLLMPQRDDDIAFDLHLKLLKEFPRDLLSLKRAQVLCFYTGRPDLALLLIEQVFPFNQNESYTYGMLAFPLLELNRMDDAEKAARKGLEMNKEDFWSQHALCHILEYDSHFKEAVDFMELCSPSWSSCSSFMYTHNWWHVSISYLEGHSSISKVLEIYDKHIWKELQRNDAEPGDV